MNDEERQRMVAGLILAGGRATRMGGGDKPLLPLRGRPLIAQVIERIAPQVGPLAISANGDPARYSSFGLPVLADALPDFPGPLAGVLAGMDWAAGLGVERLLCVAGDTPFLPVDLVARLGAHPFAMAESLGRRHPTVALWPVSLRDELRAALEGGEHRVGKFAMDHGSVSVAFDAPEDPFFNINTPEDLAEAEARA
ncbi:molybdenum cofactor guanylyltransferase MobA [Pararhodobacter sp. CCB-MM2]|uniref:molybdenum cofactor guanylyltransferase MobA n=1 Tax=Pararhodobacter sp. CCB-MM2 TaxID=1786003 RepID=UPI003510577B